MRGARPLTPGEVELARSIFGDAIDYDQVRLIRRRWWPFQPKGIVMAPTGNIHFHPASDKWSDDFSREPLSAQGLFVHEMTHVWQAQTRGRFYLLLTSQVREAAGAGQVPGGRANRPFVASRGKRHLHPALPSPLEP